MKDEYNGMLFNCIEPAIQSYFSNRVSAGFGQVDEIKSMHVQLLVSAIDYALEKIPESCSKYRIDYDLDRLVNVALDAIGDILHFAAQMLGHCDGLNENSFDDDKVLENALEKVNLRLWLNVFQNDLRLLWDNRSKWASIQEFLDFGIHVERIAWQFGIFPWYTGENIRIEVPDGIDSMLLMKNICQSILPD